MYNSVTHFINIAVPPWIFFFFYPQPSLSKRLRLVKYAGGSVFGKARLGRSWRGKPQLHGVGAEGPALTGLWRWHRGRGMLVLGEAERQRGLLPTSLASARNCFGARAFLSPLAKQLYEKMSRLQPGWHRAQRGAVEPEGPLSSLGGFWGVSLPCTTNASQHLLTSRFSTQQLQLVSWQRRFGGGLARPECSSLGMAAWGLAFKRATTYTAQARSSRTVTER